MSNNCDFDCSSCAENCSDRTEEQTSFLKKPHELSRVKKVIGIVSGKGGVGKSLVTSLLAVLLNRKGYTSAILDGDITGPSIPKSFGLREKAQGYEEAILPVLTKTGIQVMSINLLLQNDTDPVVWRGPILAGAVKQFWGEVIWKDVDFMFVDMPPGTGDVPLTVFQSLPVDGIVIVTSPQELVGMIVSKAVRMAKMMDIPVLGLVENMSYFKCPDCDVKHNIFGLSEAAAIAAEFGIDNLSNIPIDPKLTAAVDSGMVELFEGDWLDSLVAKIEKI